MIMKDESERQCEEASQHLYARIKENLTQICMPIFEPAFDLRPPDQLHSAIQSGSTIHVHIFNTFDDI
jgi:hypothetical protein